MIGKKSLLSETVGRDSSSNLPSSATDPNDLGRKQHFLIRINNMKKDRERERERETERQRETERDRVRQREIG